MVKQLLSVFLLLPALIFSQIPSYYSSVDFSQNGEMIKEQLSTLISNTHTFELPYTASSTDVWDVLKTADLDPNDASQVLLIYGFDDTDAITRNDRVRSKDDSCHSSSCTGLWNREHVFPKSAANPALDTDDPGSGTDAHNLRACDGQMNSSRSNRIFENGSGNSTITSSGNFYPGDEWKGDVARIIMYMYLRYPSQCQAADVGVGATTHQDMPDVFLQWNVEDPVSNFEIARNEAIANVQGNRNPFIDNPYLATMIWNGPDAQDLWNTLSVNDFEQYNITFSSNITRDYIYINNPQNVSYKYTIHNMNGQFITSNTSDVIDLSDKSLGVYFVNLNVNGKILRKKIVRN
ncbi:endonuclease [Aquimarina rhabdastrellae]